VAQFSGALRAGGAGVGGGGGAGKENKPGRLSAPGPGTGQVSSISMHSMASKRLSSINDASQAVIADKNWKFVEELLKVSISSRQNIFWY
jgi:hypothetical protein